jgi:hypothetical protein
MADHFSAYLSRRRKDLLARIIEKFILSIILVIKHSKYLLEFFTFIGLISNFARYLIFHLCKIYLAKSSG